MARAIDVANCIYTEYKKLSGKAIDEMKLQKLLYLSQRESIAIINEPMFAENFEGWKYGPVCREVRKLYHNRKFQLNEISNISDEEHYIVKNVVMQYGAYESWKLSELSHKEISWKNARIGIPEGANGNKILSIEDIRKDAEKVRPYDAIWDMYYDEFDDVEEA